MMVNLSFDTVLLYFFLCCIHTLTADGVSVTVLKVILNAVGMITSICLSLL